MRSNTYARHLLRSDHASVRCARLFSIGISSSTNATTGILGEHAVQSTIDLDTYLFGEKKSFGSYGLSDELVSALEAAGKLHPTIIQAKVITAVETGDDVIVGAETGSGHRTQCGSD